MSTELVVSRLGGEEYALALEQTCIKYGIESTLEKSHFLAQIMVESGYFKRTKENLNYSAKRLLEVFPGRNGLRTLEQAQAIVAQGPDAIAEQVYGVPWGERLGNRLQGDGAKFIGRGLKQLTGRYNYTEYAKDMWGSDEAYYLLDNPEILENLPDCAYSAGWYWDWKKCRVPALKDDLEGVTRLVNGGLNGLADRRKALARVKAEFAKLTEEQTCKNN